MTVIGSSYDKSLERIQKADERVWRHELVKDGGVGGEVTGVHSWL